MFTLKTSLIFRNLKKKMQESFLKVYLLLCASFRDNEKVCQCVSLASFLSFSLVAVVFRVKTNLEVPTFHMDGAFQTASSLFHLDAGHSIGKDFFPYLGIGIVYCLYPFFKLFGGDLMASTYAASFVCILAGAFVWSVPFSILQKRGNLRMFTFVFSLFLFLFASVGFQTDFYWFDAFLNPGNSLRLLRSTLPCVVFFLVFLLLRQSWNDMVKTVLLGLLAGMSFLWSNDFATPTVTVLFGTSFLMFLDDGWNSLLYRGLVMFFAFVFSAFAVGMIICDGHYVDFLCYNFKDVAGDQFWYFGDYIPYFKVLSISDFIKKVISPVSLSLCLLLFVAGIFVKTREHRWLLLSAIGTAYLGGASLTQLGGQVELGYSLFFSNWAWISLVAVVTQIFFRIRLRYMTGFLCLLVIIAFGVSLASWRNFAIAKVSAERNSDFTYISEFGGFIENKYIPYLTLARENKNKTCIEEYWGLWSALTRCMDNPKVDAIMHARGSLESVWLEKIQTNPDFVVTTRHIASDFEKVYQTAATSQNRQVDTVFDKKFRMKVGQHWTSTQYLLWSFNVNYFFYSTLFRNYTPFFSSPTTVVWKRLEKPVEFELTPVTFTEKSFVLDAKKVGFYEVSCEMEFAFSMRSILLINSGVSYSNSGVFPLNPRQRPHVFPVFFDGVNREFFFQTVPESKHFRVLSCSARHIDLNDERILPAPDDFKRFKNKTPFSQH